MTRALVAGCGYVGSTLAKRLASAGHDVWALSRGGVSLEGVDSVTGDLTEPSTLALPDVDVAVLTAAPDARDEAAYRAIYVGGATNLRNAVGSATRVVFTSSTAVYGQDDGSEVDESSPTVPASFRGRVLLEAEAVADVALRLGGIYGPSRARALESLRRGEARCHPGRYLNFIHRDDAVGALAHVALLVRPERIYIGVDQEPVESEVFYGWLAEQIGRPAPAADRSRAGKNKRCSSATLSASGYAFRYPTFRHGYRELIGPAPCPPSPNCVSSRAEDERHRMPVLGFIGPLDATRDAIVEAVRSIGGHVVKVEDTYVRAEFVSRVFGFVDDVEWWIDAGDGRVDYRSASRTGYWDLGANRRRMQEIVRRLTRNDKKIAVRELG